MSTIRSGDREWLFAACMLVLSVVILIAILRGE
jgi:hypothetical protein